jgi:uncharacterized membrane protein YsdA (DUF1294 family)
MLAAFAWLVLINGWTGLQFAVDKQAAIERRRRIPEFDLLALALLGGTPSAYVARAVFRHKTRKQPFSYRLHLIATIQVGTAIGTAATMFPPA